MSKSKPATRGGEPCKPHGIILNACHACSVDAKLAAFEALVEALEESTEKLIECGVNPDGPTVKFNRAALAQARQAKEVDRHV